MNVIASDQVDTLEYPSPSSWLLHGFQSLPSLRRAGCLLVIADYVIKKNIAGQEFMKACHSASRGPQPIVDVKCFEKVVTTCLAGDKLLFPRAPSCQDGRVALSAQPRGIGP